MGIKSGGISSIGRTSTGDVKARITRVKSTGIFTTKLTRETVHVIMTEERYLEVVDQVNMSLLSGLDEFEQGEYYD